MAVPFSTRLRVITAVSSIALLAAGSALAQSAMPPSRPPGGGPVGAAGVGLTKPRAPAPNPLTMEDVSKIDGAAVYDTSGKKIGSVSTVLMKPSSKTIDRLVVGEGGILGFGSHVWPCRSMRSRGMRRRMGLPSPRPLTSSNRCPPGISHGQS